MSMTFSLASPLDFTHDFEAKLWVAGHFQFRLSVPIGSTGSLLDIASQLLESCPRASLIVLGSNARRNVLEEDRYGCSAVSGL